MFRRTMELRLIKRKVQTYNWIGRMKYETVLQQKFIEITTGEERWSDVPIIEE